MKRFLYLYIFLVLSLLTAIEAWSQTSTPMPAAPEQIAVPAVAPNYRSDERALPDLGRVGIDPAEQRALTLRDAIELALENNRDI